MTNSSHGKSLGETVFDFVEQRRTKTAEFQLMIDFFGREKLWELYLAERLKRGIVDAVEVAQSVTQYDNK